MMVLDEDIMDNTKDKKDFALNKYYENQSWMEKSIIILLNINFLTENENVNIQQNRLNVYKDDNISDSTTIKFRKSVGNKTDYNTRFDWYNL